MIYGIRILSGTNKSPQVNRYVSLRFQEAKTGNGADANGLHAQMQGGKDKLDGRSRTEH